MWTAIYNDGIELEQFSGDKESLFKDIDQSKLTYFRVDCGKFQYLLDIETGKIMIYLNGEPLKTIDLGYNDAEHRLIYFKRHSHVLGVNSGHTVVDYLGWQTTIDGKNVKRMIGLGEELKIVYE